MRRALTALVLTSTVSCSPDFSALGPEAEAGTTTEAATATATTPSTTEAGTQSTTEAATTEADGTTTIDPGTTGTGDGSSSSEGTTGEPALVVAGELLVDLDAEHVSAGADVWVNQGGGGDFMRVGSPMRVMVGGHAGIEFFDADPPTTLYVCEQDAPASVTGVDATRTVEVWAWNDALASEETMVAWGIRGDSTGSNASFNFGTNPDFGAVGHWGDPDLGWSTPPSSDAWHHLVYTYDGTTTRVYVDGVLDNFEDLAPGAIDTQSGTPFALGAQHNTMGSYSRAGSLVLARIRVHSEALDADGVAANYMLEQGDF